MSDLLLYSPTALYDISAPCWNRHQRHAAVSFQLSAVERDGVGGLAALFTASHVLLISCLPLRLL